VLFFPIVVFGSSNCTLLLPLRVLAVSFLFLTPRFPSLTSTCQQRETDLDNLKAAARLPSVMSFLLFINRILLKILPSQHLCVNPSSTIASFLQRQRLCLSLTLFHRPRSQPRPRLCCMHLALAELQPQIASSPPSSRRSSKVSYYSHSLAILKLTSSQLRDVFAAIISFEIAPNERNLTFPPGAGTKVTTTQQLHFNLDTSTTTSTVLTDMSSMLSLTYTNLQLTY
jgi:hypothetical protein